MAPWALWPGGTFGVPWVHFLAVVEPGSEGLHVSCPSSFHLPLPLLAWSGGKWLSCSLPLSIYVEEHLSLSLLSLPFSLSLGMKWNGAFVLRSN